MNKNINILANINSLQPPITGIGRYTSQLLNHMIVENNVQAFDAVRSYSEEELKQKLANLDNHLLGTKKNQLLSPLLKETIKKLPYAYEIRQFVQQKKNQKQFEDCRDYIYWEPNYILQPFDGLSVATIYDLSYIKYPQYHTPGMLKWLEKNLQSTIRRADAIVTISDFSKNEILEQFRIPESKISIVSPSVSDEFKTSLTKDVADRIRLKYDLPAQYVLTVGTLEPRKNLTTLLDAYARLPTKLKQSFPLVIVGAKGWGNQQNLLKPMVDRGEVIVLGYVDQQDISSLYKASSLFVYISLYEGYGMPVAEAMASGVAVISSENSAMSEVAGGAAKLVNPLDVEQITDSIQYYLQEEGARKQLAEKGQLHMQNQSWQKSTNDLLALFQQLKKQ